MVIRLFHVEGTSVQVKPEVLMIDPFKTIWANHHDKMQALQKFAYIEFLVSPLPSNPFSTYHDLAQREKEVLKELKLEDWTPSQLVLDAVEKYNDWIYTASSSMEFLDAAREGVAKVTSFLKTIDLTEKNNRGMLVHNPNTIMKTISDADKTLEGLDKLEKKVVKELFEKEKVRSGAEITPFEDGTF